MNSITKHLMSYPEYKASALKVKARVKCFEQLLAGNPSKDELKAFKAETYELLRQHSELYFNIMKQNPPQDSTS